MTALAIAVPEPALTVHRSRKPDFRLHRPRSAAEAVAIKTDCGAGAVLMAGGIDVVNRLKYGAPVANVIHLARDLPPRYEGFVVEHGGPGPFGAKGIGESGMLGVAAAIGNAVEDAVGVRVAQIPFTPERVLAAIEHSSADGALK